MLISAVIQAYIEQSEQRKQAESRLTRMVRNRMDQQDRILYGGRFASRQTELDEGETATTKVLEFEDKEE